MANLQTFSAERRSSALVIPSLSLRLLYRFLSNLYFLLTGEIFPGIRTSTCALIRYALSLIFGNSGDTLFLIHQSVITSPSRSPNINLHNLFACVVYCQGHLHFPVLTALFKLVFSVFSCCPADDNKSHITFFYCLSTISSLSGISS